MRPGKSRLCGICDSVGSGGTCGSSRGGSKLALNIASKKLLEGKLSRIACARARPDDAGPGCGIGIG